MERKFLKIFILSAAFLLASCSKKIDDPLIVPPNFAEIPDPNNPEKPTAQQKDESVERLKDLLLKSDE